MWKIFLDQGLNLCPQNWQADSYALHHQGSPPIPYLGCLVAQLCPTLFDPMDCSRAGFPVLHHLLELAQTYVIELVMPSNHLILCCLHLLLTSVFPSIKVFSNESALCIWHLIINEAFLLYFIMYFPHFLLNTTLWDGNSQWPAEGHIPTRCQDAKAGIKFHCRLPSKCMQMCSAFRVSYKGKKKKKRHSQSPFFLYLTTDHFIFLSCFCAIFSMFRELTVSPKGDLHTSLLFTW